MKRFTKATVIIGMTLIVLARLICRSELAKGVCLNADGDGMLYNDEPYYNYISYKYTDANPGDELITYDLLNPLNNECDDYLFRIDYNTNTHKVFAK